MSIYDLPRVFKILWRKVSVPASTVGTYRLLFFLLGTALFYPTLYLARERAFEPLDFSFSALLAAALGTLGSLLAAHALARAPHLSKARVVVALGGCSLALTFLVLVVSNSADVPTYLSGPSTWFSFLVFLIFCLTLQLVLYTFYSLKRESLRKQAEGAISTKRSLAVVLHNTVQPDILSLSMRLRLAADQTSDPQARLQMLTTADDLVTLNKEKIRTLTRVFDPYKTSSLSESLDLLVKSFPQVKLTRRTPDINPSSSFSDLQAACIYYCVEQALINVMVHAQASHTLLSNTVSDNTLHVHVVDSGPGLPPEYREGLGLSTARLVTADLPDAYVSLRNNTKGPGATFTVSVPF